MDTAPLAAPVYTQTGARPSLTGRRLARRPADESQLLSDLAWPRERLAEVLLALKRNGLVEPAGAALRPTPMGLGFLSATAG